MVDVIVSAFCPPGKAIICNRDALGLDEDGQLVVVEDDGTRLAIEEAIERRASVLRQFAALANLGVSNQDRAPDVPDPAKERE